VLILPGAVKPWAEGMDVNAVDVRLGQPPPWLIPHCRQCRVPVERFTVDYLRSPHFIPVQFQCHGKTGGIHIPASQVLHSSRTGEAIWVFNETRTNVRHRIR
jgi:hypothetical protein